MTEARKVANNSISNEVERAQVYSAIRFYRIWIKSVITSISWNYSSTIESGLNEIPGITFSLNRKGIGYGIIRSDRWNKPPICPKLRASQRFSIFCVVGRYYFSHQTLVLISSGPPSDFLLRPRNWFYYWFVEGGRIVEPYGDHFVVIHASLRFLLRETCTAVFEPGLIITEESGQMFLK